MKNKFNSLFILVFITICLFYSCNSSIKGNWSESDKSELKESLEKNNYSADFILCFTEKMEQKYSSKCEMDSDLNGNADITDACLKDFADE